jgi:hypothetical protein
MPDRSVLRLRIVLAVLIGVLSAVYAWSSHRILLAEQQLPDSAALWRAARIMRAGGDPYPAGALNVMPAGETDLAAWQPAIEPLYYPMPALLLWLPFATDEFLLGSALFCGLGAALFAFAISRHGLHRLWLCGSMPFVVALHFGQWSPFLTAAALLPGLAFLCVAKPNLGLPLVLARPTLSVVIGCAAALALSLAVDADWVRGWLRNVTEPFGRAAPHPFPLLEPASLGFLLPLALLRWRRFEARLLFCMACVPQLPFWADQLMLAIVPETRREVIWTVISGGAAFAAYQVFAPKVQLYVPVMQPYALIATYLPALIIILRRPNAGAMPAIIERAAGYLPERLRGTATVRLADAV